MAVIYQSGHWTGGKRVRTLAWHRNRGLELVLVVNGSVTWDYDGQRVEVPPRHLSFTWPWQWHRAYDDRVPVSELYWVVLPFRRMPRTAEARLELHESLGLSRSENRQLMGGLRALPQPMIKASPLLCQLMPRAVKALQASQGSLHLSARALLLAVLAELMARMDEDPPAEEPDARARVQRFLPVLVQHCHEAWPLERMAAGCQMGRTHFTRWLKELTGDTPVQYLNRQRVVRAESLLRDPGPSVTDVAMACGFQSSQYFATVFRTFTGRAPRRAG